MRTPLALLFVLLLPVLRAQDTTEVVWAGSLAGNESAAIELTAGCSLDAFFISLDIVAPGSNWAGDMAIAITAPNGNRIEYGGYNTGFGYVDAGSWPASWNTTADGNFTATVTDLAQYDLSGSGCWLVEIMNAWTSGAASDCVMALDLIGPCASGNSEGCTDEGALNFDACAMVDDGSCVYPALSAGFNWTSTCGLPESVQFEDISLGNVAAHSWTFDAGSPATSTDP
ncbi:MAG: hypothetical protein ACPGGB_11795, partial [Flavobacteriales bacterium]